MSRSTPRRGPRIAGALTLALLVGAAAAQTPAPVAGATPDSLGRLFFTPQQRQELDHRRQYGRQQSDATDNAATYSIDGVVTRSSGRRTVWINGVAQDDDAPRNGVAVGTSRSQPGLVVVRPAGTPATRAPVGTTVSGASGEATDRLGGGRITTHPGGTR